LPVQPLEPTVGALGQAQTIGAGAPAIGAGIPQQRALARMAILQHGAARGADPALRAFQQDELAKMFDVGRGLGLSTGAMQHPSSAFFAQLAKTSSAQPFRDVMAVLLKLADADSIPGEPEDVRRFRALRRLIDRMLRNSRAVRTVRLVAPD
jgi:hypothetical protein